MRRILFCLLLLLPLRASASTLFGAIRGIVHDPHHQPIANATITLQAAHSAFTKTTQTAPDGTFTFPVLPLGDYLLTASAPNFRTVEQTLTLASNTSPILHFELPLRGPAESLTVTAATDAANINSATPTSLVSRIDIAQTPRRRPHQLARHDH